MFENLAPAQKRTIAQYISDLISARDGSRWLEFDECLGRLCDLMGWECVYSYNPKNSNPWSIGVSESTSVWHRETLIDARYFLASDILKAFNENSSGIG